MNNWRDRIDPTLMERIKRLTLEQAQNIMIYFCGYESGESMVEQALENEEEKLKRLRS